ncbi:MAG: hypothetical protein JXA23_05180 [Bacteroidales bacterium]|nr:hypothetical protein [Bacteroidales bacterium]
MIILEDRFNTIDRLSELKKNLSYLDLKDENSSITIKQEGYVTPLSITPLAAIISKKQLVIKSKGENTSYLDTVSFPYGVSDIRSILADRTYIPIIHLRINSIPSMVTNQLNEIHGIFIRLLKSNIIADPEFVQLITDQTIGFVVSEVIDNIDQHSKAENLFLFAQYWKRINTCEICIVDDGIGIYRSLLHAGRDVQSPMDAMNKMITSGLSSKFEYSGSQRGTGIKNIRDALTNREIKGEFLIISDSVGFIHSMQNGEKFLNFAPYSWSGTIIMLRFSKPTMPFDLYKYVK